MIDVAVGTRSGIPAGEGALALAQLIDKLPNLKLRGMLSYDGGVQHAKGFAARKERALQDDRAERRDVRGDEEGRAEHGDLQRRRHRHLQHHARACRASPTCRWAATCSWTCSTWRSAARTATTVYTDFAPSLTVLDHGPEQPVSRAG